MPLLLLQLLLQLCDLGLGEPGLCEPLKLPELGSLELRDHRRLELCHADLHRPRPHTCKVDCAELVASSMHRVFNL